MNASQIDFVNYVVDHLTEHGVVELGRLYETPFTFVAPMGPEALFAEADLRALLSSLDAVRRTATSVT